jgi:hypothetical protein
MANVAMARLARSALSFTQRRKQMRIFLAVALALGLSGCADSEFVEHPITSLFGNDEPAPPPDQTATQQTSETRPAATDEVPPAQAASVAVPSSVRAHCTTLAKLRAGDASFQGEDGDTQSEVYNRTYRDCVAWDAAHRS